MDPLLERGWLACILLGYTCDRRNARREWCGTRPIRDFGNGAGTRDLGEMTTRYARHIRTEFELGWPEFAGGFRLAGGGAKRYPRGRAQWVDPACRQQGAEPPALPVRRPAVRAPRPQYGTDRPRARTGRTDPRRTGRDLANPDAAERLRSGHRQRDRADRHHRSLSHEPVAGPGAAPAPLCARRRPADASQ